MSLVLSRLEDFNASDFSFELSMGNSHRGEYPQLIVMYSPSARHVLFAPGGLNVKFGKISGR